MAIRVYCRVRDGKFDKIFNDETSCNLHITHKRTQHNFEINKVWNNNETDEQIFDELIPFTRDQFVNYWVAFGYTGSGKTYTTTNLIRNLFNHLKVDKKSGLFITAIQIYNDDIYDLLNENSKLPYFKTNDLIIKNVAKKHCENIDDIMKTIQRNRTTAQTEMNFCSSRSHAIITIYYNKRKYVIVDMAGQETNSSINKDADIQKQANNINLNMLALKECIRGLKEKNKYIPYRRTLLTLALRPIFEDSCNVSFLCNVNMTQNLYYQLDSLRYASFLFSKNDKKQNTRHKLFNQYTAYIQDVGWYECNERILWNEMKEGKFKNMKNVVSLLQKKRDCIDAMMKQIDALSTVNTAV